MLIHDPTAPIVPTEAPQRLEVTTHQTDAGYQSIRIEAQDGGQVHYFFLDAERAVSWFRRGLERSERAAAWNRPAPVDTMVDTVLI